MRLCLVFVSIFLASFTATAGAAEPWFERVKATATPEQLYTFLYALPKGGDLHNHLQGAILSEWMWDSALAQEQRGYTYQ
jgi:adenosine deaminase CECR1